MKYMITWAGIITGLIAYGFYLAYKAPDNSLEWFARNRHSFAGKKTVVCVGDSITHARVSASYVDPLSGRLAPQGFVFVNAGINSELAYNVLQRTDAIISSRPDYITILIGTNDANATLSDENTARSIRNMKLPQKPDSRWYKENLTAIVNKLRRETKAEIALLSLPPIGEEPDSEAFRRAAMFSKIIRDVAAAENVTYLPLNEKMTAYLKNSSHAPVHSYENGFLLLMYEGAFRHTLLGTGFDRISEMNGFLLVTDFLHLNNRGAEMIVQLVEEFVTGNPAKKQ